MKHKCKDCEGSGMVPVMCPECDGSLAYAGQPCANCHGQGVLEDACPACEAETLAEK